MYSFLFKIDKKSLTGVILALAIGFSVHAMPQKISGKKAIPDTTLDACNVAWNTPGPGSAQSMPLGNGDIGLNVWVEKSGDLVFYISKTDAWGGEPESQNDPWMKQGGILMKLGAVRISVEKNPLTADTTFRQILKLRTGEITIREGSGKNILNYRVWVDANHSAIHVEANSSSAKTINIKLENWRAGLTDTILSDQKNRITWYHHNSPTADPHLANLTFGAIIKGNGLINKDDATLYSAKATTSQVISGAAGRCHRERR